MAGFHAVNYRCNGVIFIRALLVAFVSRLCAVTVNTQRPYGPRTARTHTVFAITWRHTNQHLLHVIFKTIYRSHRETMNVLVGLLHFSCSNILFQLLLTVIVRLVVLHVRRCTFPEELRQLVMTKHLKSNIFLPDHSQMSSKS